MIKEYYYCDAGSLAIRCGGSIIRFSNGIGDGSYKVYVLSKQEWENYQAEHEQYGLKYNYLTLCDFKDAEVLSYDCPNNLTTTITVLNGEYLIYNCYGKMYLVKVERQ